MSQNVLVIEDDKDIARLLDPAAGRTPDAGSTFEFALQAAPPPRTGL